MSRDGLRSSLMNRKMLERSLGRRFRIRPVPITVDDYGIPRELDETWLVAGVEAEGLRLQGISSSYTVLIGWDHIVERLSNPVTDPSLLGEAFLLLKSQMIFEKREVRYEPLLRPHVPPRVQRSGARKPLLIPIAGTPNKTLEAIWIGVLALLLVRALGSIEV